MEKTIVEVFGSTDIELAPVCVKRKEFTNERAAKRFKKKWMKRLYDDTGSLRTVYTHIESCDVTPAHTGIHVMDRCMAIT